MRSPVRPGTAPAIILVPLLLLHLLSSAAVPSPADGAFAPPVPPTRRARSSSLSRPLSASSVPEAAAPGMGSRDDEAAAAADGADRGGGGEVGVGYEDEKKKEEKSRTQRIMERTSPGGQAGGAGGSSTWDAFLRAESNWERLRSSKSFAYDPELIGRAVQGGAGPPPKFVTDDGSEGDPRCWAALRERAEAAAAESGYGPKLDYDVAVCGGTLGIFVALALQLRGHRVAVVEAGKLMGREQEWNISMDELLELVELGVLTEEDIDEAVNTEFPGCRSGFKNREVPTAGSYLENGVGYECFTPDVLNLGVSPAVLIENASKRFAKLGGTIMDRAPLRGIAVSESVGAALDLGDGADPLTSRLVLDCMGNASPVSRQQRYGMKPDGICCVVGSCAGGYDKETNLVGDIIYTNTEIQDKGEEGGRLQYFWEAFPVGIGRDGKEPGTSDVKTTYMFTYLDADEGRPSLSSLMEDYWDLLPVYQPSITDPETDLDVKRVLFAYFPTYRDSPLRPRWSRVLAVGDASGIQSPLSFGGFGALTRHLGRISGAVSEALDSGCLHRSDLAEINAYTPNLSAAWMFQRAMSVRMGQVVDPKFVNRLLATNFELMDGMGIDTIKPFLQDVIRLDGLAGSLSRAFAADPTFMPQIVAHVGIPALADWLGHVAMMAVYTALHNVGTPVLGPIVDGMDDGRERFRWRRRMESWRYGSGSDYVLPSRRE